MACRVCLEEEETENNKFVTPCKCKGDAGIIHEKCLNKWIETSGRNECEICNTSYTKKEIMSFQLKKYICGCMVCDCNKYNTQVFLSTFVFTMFFLLTNNIEDIKLITYIVLGIMYAFSLAMFVKQSFVNTEHNFSVDSLLVWKLSYTISLSISLGLQLVDSQSDCENLCMYVHKKTCNAKCPTYHFYTDLTYNISKLMLFDFINLCCIILLRSLVLCQKYNKKTVFDNYHEETQPLIEV